MHASSSMDSDMSSEEVRRYGVKLPRQKRRRGSDATPAQQPEVAEGYDSDSDPRCCPALRSRTHTRGSEVRLQGFWPRLDMVTEIVFSAVSEMRPRYASQDTKSCMLCQNHEYLHATFLFVRQGSGQALRLPPACQPAQHTLSAA